MLGRLLWALAVIFLILMVLALVKVLVISWALMLILALVFGVLAYFLAGHYRGTRL